MNGDAERLLEFGKVRDILARYTVTAMGREQATGLQPTDDLRALRRALDETTQMADALAEGYSLPIGAPDDMRPAAERARAGGGPLEPRVLWRVAGCLETSQRVASSLRRLGTSSPALVRLGSRLPQNPELVEAIRGAVDSGGRVLDEASPELKQIRRRMQRLRKKIESRLRQIIDSENVRPHLQYPNPTMVRDRYVLPVNAYRKQSVQGIVHGSSDSGATLYIEPMAVIEMGNDLSEAIGEEEEEVERVLWKLTREVGAAAEDVIGAVQALGEVDLVRAKAMMSNAFRMCRPEMTQSREADLLEARHPLLLWLTHEDEERLPDTDDLDFDAVVPMDLHLGGEFDLLILTGPNTGGKTVVLKTLGLLCLMARSGMHVPAESATFPLYDAVYADIGDEQSLEQSLSTFSSHMSRIINILETASEHSLVLLDELGAGTDPAEGSALGEAILEQIGEIGCSACVVTHLGRLKTFAGAHAEAENASMEFDTRTLKPTYRLSIGSVGSSNALEIAERLGLPEDLLDHARALLDEEAGGEYSTMLEEIQIVREEAEERRDRMRYLEQEAEDLKEEYEDTLARIKAAEDRQSATVGLQIRDRLQELKAEADRLGEGLQYTGSATAKRRIRAIQDGLAETLSDISTLLEGHSLDRRLQEGDEVYVTKVHRWGEVERVDERRGRAKVNVGGMQMDVALDELQAWGETAE